MTNQAQQPEATAAATQPEQELNFVFKVSEVNLILGALEELPHKVSRKLIDNIFTQAQPQVQKAPQTPETN
jgi:hypothetical protein